MRIAAAVMLCWVAPASAGAQTAPVVLPDNDTIVAVGWTGSEHELQTYDSWHGGLLVSIAAGHYWTDHLKTEFEAGWSTTGTNEVFEDINYAGALTYALTDHRARDFRIGATQIYQFGRNAWIHPFVGAGFDVIRRETTLERLPQSRTLYFPPNRSVPVTIPPSRERRNDVFAQGVLKTGVKMYASEKMFFTTELKFGLREDVDHVVWKLGLGFDF